MPKRVTKKQDAASIVGKDLAEELEAQAKIETKSNVLIEMSDVEEADEEDLVVDDGEPEKEAPVVAESKHDKEKDESPEEDTKGDEEEMPMDKKKKHMMKADISDEMLVAEIVEQVKAQLAPSPVTVEEKKVEKSALDVSVEKLYTTVQEATNVEGTVEQKLESIQPALNELGQTIMTIVQGNVATAAVETKPDEVSKLVLDTVSDLKKSVETLALTVQEMKSQIAQPTPPAQPRIPAPRSITPDMMKSVVKKAQPDEVKPGSLQDRIRQSVGLPPARQ